MPLVPPEHWEILARSALCSFYCAILFDTYKGCSESNASYFILLAHGARGGRQWYGSRG